MLFVAAGVAAWTTTKNDVLNAERRVTTLEEAQRALATEQRQQRDILIRIDANVSAMKERQGK